MNPEDQMAAPPQGDTSPEPRTRPSVSRPSVESRPDGPAPTTAGRAITLRKLNAYYGDNHAVKDVDLDYVANKVTAMIGPSGCGKSTLVRCINRMHEEIPGARSTGEILLDELDLHDGAVDVVSVRRAT